MKNEIKCQMVALIVVAPFFEDEPDNLSTLLQEAPVDPFAARETALRGRVSCSVCEGVDTGGEAVRRRLARVRSGARYGS